MAWTQYGDPALGDWTPQPDAFRARQGENGGWHATHAFKIKTATLDEATFQGSFAYLTGIATHDPDIPAYWSFLKLDSIPAVMNLRGGYSEITVKYAGYFVIKDGQGATTVNKTYRLRGELGERSLLEHNKVVALGLADRLILAGLYDGLYFWNGSTNKVAVRVVDENGDETFSDLSPQPTAGDALAFANLIVKGERTYRHPTFVWEARWQDDKKLPTATINKLGHTDLPTGDPPTPNGGRDWMLTYASQDTDGEMFNLALDWTLSERGGWDSDIYDT